MFVTCTPVFCLFWVVQKFETSFSFCIRQENSKLTFLCFIFLLSSRFLENIWRNFGDFQPLFTYLSYKYGKSSSNTTVKNQIKFKFTRIYITFLKLFYKLIKNMDTTKGFRSY